MTYDEIRQRIEEFNSKEIVVKHSLYRMVRVNHTGHRVPSKLSTKIYLFNYIVPEEGNGSPSIK